jgi:hypothetical protein
VWLDLDCVVTGNLDPVLGRTEDFIAWKDIAPPQPYCGSLVMMDAGARRQVWDEFDPMLSPAYASASGYVGTDQGRISAKLGLGEATWDERDGVLSYRRDCHSSGLPECSFMGLPIPAFCAFKSNRRGSIGCREDTRSGKWPLRLQRAGDGDSPARPLAWPLARFTTQEAAE